MQRILSFYLPKPKQPCWLLPHPNNRWSSVQQTEINIPHQTLSTVHDDGLSDELLSRSEVKFTVAGSKQFSSNPVPSWPDSPRPQLH